MAARTRSESPVGAESNGLPQRHVSEGGIPARVGRPRNNYDAWKPEVDALYDDLGNAFTYYDVPKCQSVANGLRRTYGVDAASSQVDKATGIGTLHITLPVIVNDDDTLSVDEAAMEATKTKYAK